MDPADQPVGVLIGSPLPGVAGAGEEHVRMQLTRNQLVAGELLAVVEGDPVNGDSGFHEEVDNHEGDRVRLLALAGGKQGTDPKREGNRGQTLKFLLNRIGIGK